MADTYTYIARNADNPDLVMTFTLENGHLRLGLAEVLEKVGQISQAEEKAVAVKEQLKSQLQPGMVTVIGNYAGPIQIGDATATLDGGDLKVSAWQRVGGLRLAPFWLNMGRVDNTEAAEAFVNELEKRKASVPHAGRFFGPLDYWVGWAGLFLLIAFLLRWPLQRGQNRSG